MEFQKVVEERRSIRSFDNSKNIEKDLVIKALTFATQNAPSWKNTQTPRYRYINSEEMLSKVRECLPEFNRISSFGAHLVVTSFVKNRSGFEKDGTPTNEVGNGWGYYDLGLSNELFVLKAKELGLSSLIMGIRDEEKLKEVLEISENELIGPVIAIGYNAISPEKPLKKSPNDTIFEF